ncbi:3-keto-steroid reductase [Kickxella alabastrina]|nr:3-keto-steroid reductase [Kickxella alabastrina]
MPPSIQPASPKVVLITGGNSGVGLALARRLLALSIAQGHRQTIILGCRNPLKAQKAISGLLQPHLAHKDLCDVQLVEIDTSSVASVTSAAIAIEKKYSRLDRLFCNAGAMAIAGLNPWGIIQGILTHPVAFFESSEALYQKRGLVTADGLGLTFQTNVFGHYLLVHKLAGLLERTGGARVIWTGSAASQLEFLRTDYQHVLGAKPYESSKYIVDQIAIPMDRRLAQRGVRCLVAEPGNVCSNFLAGLGQAWLEWVILCAFYLCRLCLSIPRFTISSVNACEACVLLGVSEGQLDSNMKYHSRVDRWGAPFVDAVPLVYDKRTGAFLVERMDALVRRFEERRGNE